MLLFFFTNKLESNIKKYKDEKSLQETGIVLLMSDGVLKKIKNNILDIFYFLFLNREVLLFNIKIKILKIIQILLFVRLFLFFTYCLLNFIFLLATILFNFEYNIIFNFIFDVIQSIKNSQVVHCMENNENLNLYTRTYFFTEPDERAMISEFPITNYRCAIPIENFEDVNTDDENDLIRIESAQHFLDQKVNYDKSLLIQSGSPHTSGPNPLFFSTVVRNLNIDLFKIFNDLLYCHSYCLEDETGRGVTDVNLADVSEYLTTVKVINTGLRNACFNSYQNVVLNYDNLFFQNGNLYQPFGTNFFQRLNLNLNLHQDLVFNIRDFLYNPEVILYKKNLLYFDSVLNSMNLNIDNVLNNGSIREDINEIILLNINNSNLIPTQIENFSNTIDYSPYSLYTRYPNEEHIRFFNENHLLRRINNINIDEFTRMVRQRTI